MQTVEEWVWGCAILTLLYACPSAFLVRSVCKSAARRKELVKLEWEEKKRNTSLSSQVIDLNRRVSDLNKELTIQGADCTVSEADGKMVKEIMDTLRDYEIRNFGERVTLQQRVGAGAFGEVFQASMASRGGAAHGRRPVAVKRLQRGRISKRTLSEVREECRLLSGLDHPNVVGFEGIACDSIANLYIVLELCPSGDLERVLANPIIVPTWTETKFDIALGVAEGVAHLHSQEPPVIHRDLKPANILFTANLTPKLADFGASRARDEAQTMTQVGTPLYMAPEVLMNERYDESVDTWSFGVVLSYLCTASHPAVEIITRLHSEEPEEVMQQAIVEGLPATVCPQPLRPILAQCFRSLGQDRTPMAELVSSLHEQEVGICAHDDEVAFYSEEEDGAGARKGVRFQLPVAVEPQDSDEKGARAPPRKSDRSSKRPKASRMTTRASRMSRMSQRPRDSAYQQNSKDLSI